MTSNATTTTSCKLRYHKAGNGTRTRDPNLGKVVLYQLSYSRKTNPEDLSAGPTCFIGKTHYRPTRRPHRDGDERDRTADLLNAIQALSQLSYAPGARHPRCDDPEGAQPRGCQEPRSLVGCMSVVKQNDNGLHWRKIPRGVSCEAIRNLNEIVVVGICSATHADRCSAGAAARTDRRDPRRYLFLALCTGAMSRPQDHRIHD